MIEHILICSLCIVGIHEATRDGMALEKISTFTRLNLGEFWSKPFTECLTCMASVWGSAYFGLVLGSDPNPVRSWVIFVLAVAGMNATYGNYFYKN